jgi:hypothetical protein
MPLEVPTDPFSFLVGADGRITAEFVAGSVLAFELASVIRRVLLRR